MTAPPFHQRFNIEIDLEEARKRFVNRVYNQIFEAFFLKSNNQEEVFLALQTVANFQGVKWNYHYTFDKYVQSDFMNCIQAIEAIYSVTYRKRELELYILRVIALSEHDLEIEWRDGSFYPSGAKLLDDTLVNENLKWLADNKFQSILEPFNKALLHYSESTKHPEKLKDVITDMYESLEATAKWVNNNNSDLSSNKVQFIDELGLSKEHQSMINSYITYANRYHRHAKGIEETPVPISVSDTENFIYMTGIFIRFAIQKKKSSIIK